MAYNHIETAIALESLRAPLTPNPNTDQERILNEMRAKYRSYFVEYNVGEGAVVMPGMFCDDFGDEVPRVATLVDANENKFECLVEKVNGNVYLTRGWVALRDFYDIRIGAWLMLLYIGSGQFFLTVHDRFQQLMYPPIFVPPMKFVIDLHGVPSYFVDDLPESTKALSYSHDSSFFQLSHEKRLTFYDISTGFLMLPYDGFGEFAFNEDTTSVKLVDDCGNAWDCTLVHVTFPFTHFKVGGEWSRLVAARRLIVGEHVKIGAKSTGDEQTLYLMFNPSFDVVGA